MHISKNLIVARARKCFAGRLIERACLCIGMCMLAQLGSAASFDALYLVGQYGVVHAYDSGLVQRQSGVVVHLPQSEAIGCADITPDGERLVLAVNTPSSPVLLVRTEDLRIDDAKSFDFPPLADAYASHQCEGIYALSNRFVYLVDIGYDLVENPFNWILLDLDRQTVQPARSMPRARWERDVVRVSPDRKTVAFVVQDSFVVVDVSTARITRQIDIIPPRGEDWREIVTIDVGWQNSQVDIQCANHSRDQKDRISFVRMRANLADGQFTQEEAAQPRFWALRDKNTQIGRFAAAYSVGVGRVEGSMPAFDPPLCQALERLRPGTLDALTFTPRRVYLSADGKYLFAVRVGSRNPDEGDLAHPFLSAVTVIDLDAGKVVKEISFPDEVVTVLIH